MEALQYFKQFFNSNICIPRGDNPHPHADVLHSLAENEKLDIQIQSNSAWVKPTALYECNLRIKPSEPVYEYLWMYPDDKNPRVAWFAVSPGEMEQAFCDDDTPIKWIRTETKRIRE
jgi:hypothetical protein